LSRRPPAIWVRDLAQALATLRPRDQATVDSLVATLGLGEAALEVTAAEPAPDLAEAEAEAPSDAEGRAGPEAAPVEVEPAEGTGDALELALARRESPARQRIEVQPLDTRPTEDRQPPPLRPLFRPRWTRGIVSASLSTQAERGPVDVDRTVEILARGGALHELPKLPWPTTRHGVQVLVDTAEAMTPFAQDQQVMVSELNRILGSHNVTVQHFAAAPLRGAGTGPRRAWGEWLPPNPGTPVALLTDLGVTHPAFSLEPASPSEWLDFAVQAQRARCPVVAFVPHSPDRVAPALRRAMAVVHWDRSTTATSIRGQVGRVLERRL
jgi:hypothetical protein